MNFHFNNANKLMMKRTEKESDTRDAPASIDSGPRDDGPPGDGDGPPEAGPFTEPFEHCGCDAPRHRPPPSVTKQQSERIAHIV